MPEIVTKNENLVSERDRKAVDYLAGSMLTFGVIWGIYSSFVEVPVIWEAITTAIIRIAGFSAVVAIFYAAARARAGDRDRWPFKK